METEENNNEPPPNEQTDSGMNGNASQPSTARRARQPRVPRRLRNQTNTPNATQDDELKAQMRAARENAAATTVDPNASITIPDEDQGPRVGDDVDIEHLVSVPSTPRRASTGAIQFSETAGARVARAPSIRSPYTDGRRLSGSKPVRTPVANGQRVGAIEVQERAFGYMPAWYRQSPENRQSLGNISPENMIPINEQEGVDMIHINEQDGVDMIPINEEQDGVDMIPINEDGVDTMFINEHDSVDLSQPIQAELSGEFSLVDSADLSETFQAEVSREFTLIEPTEQTHQAVFGDGSVDNSVDISLIAEDPAVEDAFKKFSVPKTFCIAVVVLGIVGAVIVGLIWREKHDVSIEIASTPITITGAPTPAAIWECSDFRDIDPLVQRMDVDTFDQYNLLLENVVQKLMPEYTSPGNVLEELCSPYHRALVWVASDALSKESFKVAENRFMLAFLYLSWKGDTWSIEERPWLSNTTECDWLGISCNDSGQIVELDWSISKDLTELSVTIPEEIGLLTDLTSLKLNVNFIGSLPSTMGNLTNLAILDLSSNFQLSGAFPYDEIRRLGNLRTLSLSDNFNMLAFPSSSINQLSSLEYLDVARTQRSNQDLPTEIGDLVNLVVLSTRETAANGRIPTEISKLTNLEYLNLGRNDIQDGLVSEIGLLKNLSTLILDNNALSGQIPTEIGSLSHLETLNLEGNLISGALPHEIGNCTYLEYLSLSRTDIDEDLPIELFSLTNLASLHLSEVLLIGSIPLELFTLPNLQIIDLAETPFTGNTTIDLLGLTKLECFDITNTNLAGALVVGGDQESCRLDFASGASMLDECVAMELDTCTCCQQEQVDCDGVEFKCQKDLPLFEKVPQPLKDRFL